MYSIEHEYVSIHFISLRNQMQPTKISLFVIILYNILKEKIGCNLHLHIITYTD